MEKKIVSTTYAPLQPPYQIIKYSGDIAMQIGTLIVTIQKEGNANGLGYEIETHSHPVVTYENKDIIDPDRRLSNGYQFMEGAVWNYVEVKDVTTICLSNSKLSWYEFTHFLWDDLMHRPKYFSLPTIDAYWALRHFCKEIGIPTMMKHTIHLWLEAEDREHAQVRSKIDDILTLCAPIDAVNKDKWKDEIKRQLRKFDMILRNGMQLPNTSYRFCIEYEGDEFCNEFAEELNSINTYTQMGQRFNKK